MKFALTKKDCLAALVCAVFALMCMGAIGGGSRKHAKDIVCRTNLKQLGLVFYLYANDNDGSFPQGYPSNGVTWEEAWMLGATLPYYKELDIRKCPTTSSPDEATIQGGTFEDWGTFPESLNKNQWYDSFAAGSYGFNNWCVDVPEDLAWWGLEHKNAIRKIYDKRAYIIPLVCDSVYVDTAPYHFDQAPSNQEHEMDEYIADWDTNSMKYYCIDRHNGGINGAFVDMHVQHIGIKQLWRLKWHNNFDTSVIPTFDTWLEQYKDY